MQTDNLFSTRRPDLVIVNKKKRTCQIVDFAVPADHRVRQKENEKKDKYLDLARELKKLWNMKAKMIPSVISAFSSHQRIGKGIGGLGIWQTSGDHPNYSNIKIGQNTEKSHIDLRRLAVTQTLVKDHHQTLARKTLKKIIMII